MMDLTDRLGVEFPIVQSGMAGGLATPELAAAVSRSGGLGSIGLLPPRGFAVAVECARRLAEDRPIAVNLLLPFVRRAHVEICIRSGVRAAVLFFGFRPDVVASLRSAGVVVLHQVGTIDEARRALADGADALIAQGIEAGGHLLGAEPTLDFVRRLRASEFAINVPILAAGGIVRAGHVKAARAAGANGVMAGSRFLLTEESGAHPSYQQRLLGAPRTIVTRLFGFGWPARHRVVPNKATDRWCREDGNSPRWINSLQHLTARPLASLSSLLMESTPPNRLWMPIYSPAGIRAGMNERLVDFVPLYAGECVREIHHVTSAANVVADLRDGW